MARKGTLAIIAVGMAVAIGWAARAEASCSSGCGSISHACQWAVNIDWSGCRAACKGLGLGTDCSKACNEDRKAGRSACLDERSACRLGCDSADPCHVGCGAAALGCAGEPASTLRKLCIIDCKTAYKDARALCTDKACANEALVALGGCYYGCGAALRSIGDACNAGLEMCIADCP